MLRRVSLYCTASMWQAAVGLVQRRAENSAGAAGRGPGFGRGCRIQRWHGEAMVLEAVWKAGGVLVVAMQRGTLHATPTFVACDAAGTRT